MRKRDHVNLIWKREKEKEKIESKKEKKVRKKERETLRGEIRKNKSYVDVIVIREYDA